MGRRNIIPMKSIEEAVDQFLRLAEDKSIDLTMTIEGGVGINNRTGAGAAASANRMINKLGQFGANVSTGRTASGDWSVVLTCSRRAEKGSLLGMDIVDGERVVSGKTYTEGESDGQG